jgi:hypothetical protein
MPRPCSICAHPKRQQIDVALMTHASTYRKMAQAFDVGEFPLYRHQGNCLHLSLRLSKGLTATLSADNLLAKLGELDEVTREILAKAHEEGNARNALAAIRESRANIESFAHIGPMSEHEERLRALEEGRTGNDDNARGL